VATVTALAMGFGSPNGAMSGRSDGMIVAKPLDLPQFPSTEGSQPRLFLYLRPTQFFR